MKWLILFAVAALGCLLIGDGILPLVSSGRASQSDFAGWMQIAAGIPCLCYVALNLKSKRKDFAGRN